MDWVRRLAAVLAGVWLGAQLFTYVVASVLFARLPALQAGDIAGTLFHIVNLSGIAVWLLVCWLGYGECRFERMPPLAYRWAKGLLLALAANEFLITPVIEALKQNRSNWLHALTGGSFGMWHGVSSTVYLLCSLIALGLSLRLLRLQWQR